jgi:hypothetical protein
MERELSSPKGVLTPQQMPAVELKGPARDVRHD